MNLIEKNGKIYGFDVMNGCLYDINTLEAISEKEEVKEEVEVKKNPSKPREDKKSRLKK